MSVVLAMGVGSSRAQTRPDPFDQARHRRGPLALDPEFRLENIGIDTNVFNDPADPRRDFTSTVRPGADIWFRMGRTRVEGHSHVALNYFAQYDSERSADTTNRARVELRGPRVTPYAQVGFVSARDRLTPEIDARVRRQERTAALGADVALGARTTVRVGVGRFTTQFSDQVAAGTYSTSLDRRETSIQASVRYRLTPLTTLVVETDRQRNRFDFASERDAGVFRVMPGAEFDAGALIQGRAVLGIRRFNFDSPAVKDFLGFVTAVNLSYAPRPTLQLGFTADRNLEYSFDILQPYYVTSGIGADVTQQFTQRWSGLARIWRQRLRYQQAEGLAQMDRIDGVTQMSTGLRYRLGPHARAEGLATLTRRTSVRFERVYSGLRVGSAVIYEF